MPREPGNTTSGNTAWLWIGASHAPALLGMKGAGAAELLRAHGLRVPPDPNRWEYAHAESGAHDVPDAPLLLRLGRGEYLLATNGADALLPRLADALANAASQASAYAVLREDRCISIGGPRATQLLAELCSVDFAAADAGKHGVVLTLLAGVAVTVIEQPVHTYRIWCDPSFAEYLWESIRDAGLACGAELCEDLPSWAVPAPPSPVSSPSRPGPEHRGSHP